MTAHLELAQVTAPPFLSDNLLVRYLRLSSILTLKACTQLCILYSFTLVRDHLLEAPRVLKYMCTVKDRSLTFGGSHEFHLPPVQVRLAIYSHSDWIIGSTDWKTFWKCGLHEWRHGWLVHSRQHIVVASVTEAEPVAVFDAYKDGLSRC